MSEWRWECCRCRALRRREGEKKKKAPLCSGDMWATGCDRMGHRSLSHSHTLTEIVITQIKCHSNKRKPAERVKSGVFIYGQIADFLTPCRQVGEKKNPFLAACDEPVC